MFTTLEHICQINLLSVKKKENKATVKVFAKRKIVFWLQPFFTINITERPTYRANSFVLFSFVTPKAEIIRLVFM